MGIAKEAAGKISVFDTRTYFAVDKGVSKNVLKNLQEGKIKGKTFRVRPIS